MDTTSISEVLEVFKRAEALGPEEGEPYETCDVFSSVAAAGIEAHISAPTMRFREFAKNSVQSALNHGRLAVFGHRGSGMISSRNPAYKHHSAVRENTMGAMAMAHEAGVDGVEFDIQVTSDGVCVLFHDTHMKCVAGDAIQSLRVTDLTLDQFREASRRLASVQGQKQNLKEYDGMTFREMFEMCPPSLSFDVEVKLPVEGLAPQQLERTVLTILKEIEDYCQPQRRLFLSSFFAPACALLSHSSSHPTFLLVRSRHEEGHNDYKLGDAAQFAFVNQLDGVVAEVDDLITDLPVIGEIKAKGLTVLSYGVGNNDPANVAVQQAQGVELVIIDDVPGLGQNLCAIPAKAAPCPQGCIPEVDCTHRPSYVPRV